MNCNDPEQRWEDAKNWQRKLSNKHNSREFAKKYNCRVPDLYWKGRDVSRLDFNKLPENFVIRPTIGHSLCMVFLMKGAVNLMDGKKYTAEEIKAALDNVICQNPKVEFLVEEFVRTEKGEYKIPEDYKFYTFNGRICCIQVINRVNNKIGCTSWYDEAGTCCPTLPLTTPTVAENRNQNVLTKCWNGRNNSASLIKYLYELIFMQQIKVRFLESLHLPRSR
jgi:hypothetical protein